MIQTVLTLSLHIHTQNRCAEYLLNSLLSLVRLPVGNPSIYGMADYNQQRRSQHLSNSAIVCLTHQFFQRLEVFLSK